MPGVCASNYRDVKIIKKFPAAEQKLAMELYREFLTLQLLPLIILSGGFAAFVPAILLLELIGRVEFGWWLFTFLIVVSLGFISGCKITSRLCGWWVRRTISRIYIKANESLFSQKVLQRLCEKVELVRDGVKNYEIQTFIAPGRLEYPREISFK
jgi:hypothetical protein